MTVKDFIGYVVRNDLFDAEIYLDENDCYHKLSLDDIDWNIETVCEDTKSYNRPYIIIYTDDEEDN